MSCAYSVPFYPNTPDDTHCFQAVLQMILGYFEPELKLSMEELEEISHKLPGMWTWPMATMLWLHERRYEVKNIEVFSYPEFIQDPRAYMITFFGEEVAKISLAHCVVESEVEYARKVYDLGLVEERLPSISDIVDSVSHGHLVGCTVNSLQLNNQTGFAGHFVLVIGCTDKELILHDPGLPPIEGRKVTFSDFEKAWAYPSEKIKNVLLVRKP